MVKFLVNEETDIFQMYFLILSNGNLRVRELRNLKWDYVRKKINLPL